MRSNVSIGRRAQLLPIERVVRDLHRLLPAFNETALTWDNAVQLADRLGVAVVFRKSRHDAVLEQRPAKNVIAVDRRLNLPTWGVFCVVHELVHFLVHPGSREFYLASPGWHDRTESQANVVALLSLWPFGERRPLPRILRLRSDDELVTFDVHFVSQRRSLEFGPQWISRTLTLQRYR